MSSKCILFPVEFSVTMAIKSLNRVLGTEVRSLSRSSHSESRVPKANFKKDEILPWCPVDISSERQLLAFLEGNVLAQASLKGPQKGLGVYNHVYCTCYAVYGKRPFKLVRLGSCNLYAIEKPYGISCFGKRLP